MQMQTGIDQALISKFESGERVPPTETLIPLADFFDTSMIISWDGQMRKKPIQNRKHDKNRRQKQRLCRLIHFKNY